MATLLDLSLELLTLIARLVDDRHDLTQICLVCRPVYTAAVPVLYERFQQYRETAPDAVRQLFDFARTISSCPGLAVHVKRAALLDLEKEYNVPRRENSGAVVQFNDRHYGRPSHVTMGVLRQLPHLETLLYRKHSCQKVEFGDLPRSLSGICISIANIASAREELLFRSSQSEDWRTHTQNGRLSFTELESIFAMPNMRSLEVRGANASKMQDDVTGDNKNQLREAEPTLSYLERLSLENARMDPDSIARLVRRCARLKEFRFTYGSHLDTDRRDFTPSQLVEALAPHGDSLEVLHLDLDDDFLKPRWSSEKQAGPRLCTSLQRFAHLRRLELSFSTLFGVSAFPLRTARFLADLFTAREMPLRLTNTGSLDVSLAELFPDSLQELTVMTCDSQINTFLVEVGICRDQGQLPNLSLLRCTFSKSYVMPQAVPRVSLANVSVDYVFVSDSGGPASGSSMFDDEELCFFELC